MTLNVKLLTPHVHGCQDPKVPELALWRMRGASLGDYLFCCKHRDCEACIAVTTSSLDRAIAEALEEQP